MVKYFLILTVLGFSLIELNVASKHLMATDLSKPFDHSTWDKLLKKHVREDGLVSYEGFVQDSVRLNAYLKLLSSNHPNENTWSREEQMAYWINAYNAFTVKLIVDAYPVASIKEIKRGIAFVNSVWDIKFIEIGDKKYDLNNIEHGILRRKFQDARIHAAVNCASFSCPPLRGEAYTADKLEAQLEDAMRKFINDSLRNRVTREMAEISKIFNWFSGDFKRDAGSVRNYINRYAKKKLNKAAKITYLDYDWRLNTDEIY